MSRMQRFDWLARQSRGRHSQNASRHDRRLRVEQLEDRRMLAVITVDSLLDNFDPGAPATDGLITLREAILAANTDAVVGDAPAGSGADTIEFGSALSGQTITLGGTDLEITEALTIDATALTNNVTIDANRLSRIFNITATTGGFTLAGLTLTGGRTTGDNVNFSDTTFSGGAVRSLMTGVLTLDQSTISGNSTTGTYARGGGIFSFGDVTLTSSTVSGNSAFSGGGIFTSSGAVTLTSSTVSGNSATGFIASGGGIYTDSGAVTLTGSTVSGNTSDGRGGGIFTRSGDVTLSSSTMTGNSAVGAGGGVYVVNTVTNPTFLIENSIVAGNTDDGTAADLRPDPDSTLTINFSLIGDNDGTGLTEAPVGFPDINGNLIGGPNNGVIDPLLGLLTSNGGPTETHALLATSPAIDAGDPSIVFNPTEFDQRGAPFARVFDDPVALGSGIDMGAYEVQTAVADSADFDGDGFVTGSDFLAWQRGFGTTTGAAKSDGDADNDGDVDGVDLGFWEAQFGGPAPAVAATSSLVVESSLAAEPSPALQVEDTAALTSTSEESVASRLPDNFIVSPSDLGLEFRFTTPRQVPVRAAHPSAEQIDEALRSDWHAWPEQNPEFASDDFVLAIHGRSAKATQPADQAFAELADDEGFVGLGPLL